VNSLQQCALRLLPPGWGVTPSETYANFLKVCVNGWPRAETYRVKWVVILQALIQSQSNRVAPVGGLGDYLRRFSALCVLCTIASRTSRTGLIARRRSEWRAPTAVRQAEARPRSSGDVRK